MQEIQIQQLQALRAESAAYGDLAQVLICDIASGAVDPSDGYDHLSIWSHLSAADRRRVAEIDCTERAQEICDEAIETGLRANTEES